MRHLVAAALAGLLLTTVYSAHAGPPFACCVCEAPVSALFCASVPSSEITEFVEDCDDDGGVAVCSAAADPSQCAAVFEGAECPATAAPVAVPAAGTGGVLALAVVLAGVGAAALRGCRRGV